MNYKHLDIPNIEAHMFNNAAMIKEFIGLYIAQTPKDFALLGALIAEGDLVKIAQQAHHIKPTMSYLGAVGLQEQLQRLELHAKEAAAISQIQASYQRLQTDIDLLLEELTAYHAQL